MLKVSDERSVCMCLTESSRIECKGIVRKLRQIDGVILVRILHGPPSRIADSEVLIAYKPYTLLLTPTMAEAEALQRKKRVRAGHRASATRIQGQITTALGATPPNVERLSMLKLTLEAKQKTLKELDDEIVVLVPDEELDTEINLAGGCAYRL